jgi:hypothetical protein
MKKSKLRQLIKQVINEQFTDKDIVGACQNKELIELSDATIESVIVPWLQWTQTLQDVPDNPTFIIDDPQATPQLAFSYIMAAGEGNFNDFYFSVVNSIPSDLGPAGFLSPLCPYGYVSTMPLTIIVNGQSFNFNFFNFGNLLEQIQSTTWGPTIFGMESVGGLDNVTDFNSLFTAINTLNASSETVNINMSFPPITVNMCNCIWTDIIEGCMDDTMCNYDPEAGSDDGSCVPPNECNSCTGDLSCIGCIDYEACNYDSNLLYVDNSLCDYTSCQGCMDDGACNYDPTATIQASTSANGACEYESCVGCMDPEALNYDPEATIQASGASGCMYEDETYAPERPDKAIPDKVVPDTGNEYDPYSDVRPERPIDLSDDGTFLQGGPVQYGITACNPNSYFFDCMLCCQEINQENLAGGAMYSEECGCGVNAMGAPTIDRKTTKRLKELANIKKKK